MIDLPNDQELGTVTLLPGPNEIVFYQSGEIRFKGRPLATDQEIVDGIGCFLKLANCYGNSPLRRRISAVLKQWREGQVPDFRSGIDLKALLDIEKIVEEP
jgi:hypothetical protein